MKFDFYCIVPRKALWSLELNGEPLATFDERWQAEQAARVAARMSVARGRTPRIIVA
jgi:hypothetical protein